MKLLILGANSDVGYAVAKIFARKEKADIYLAARDTELLKKKILDLKARYSVEVTAYYFDAIDYASHSDFYHTLDPKPDGVLLCFGYLGDQKKAEGEFSESQKIIETNFVGSVSMLNIIAADFYQRETGFILGISSVAGERGRQSNYVYGASKAALSVYLSGLRNRLSKKNIQVLTVLPGFIRTKMTEGLDLPEILMADPDEVAENIYNALKKKKNIIYTRWFWKWIMFIIKHIPENIFKKMDL